MTELESHIAEQLVERAMGGDRGALAELLESAKPLVTGHLNRYRFSEADLEDVTQDVMLQVVRKLHLFRGDAQFTTWLFRITANAALMQLRGSRRRGQVLVPSESALLEAVPVPTQTWSSRPDEQFEEREAGNSVARAVDALAPIYKRVVTAFYFDDEPLTDISARLGLSGPGARSRVHRARDMLREVLEEEHGPRDSED